MLFQINLLSGIAYIVDKTNKPHLRVREEGFMFSYAEVTGKNAKEKGINPLCIKIFDPSVPGGQSCEILIKKKTFIFKDSTGKKLKKENFETRWTKGIPYFKKTAILAEQKYTELNSVNHEAILHNKLRGKKGTKFIFANRK